MNTMLQTPTKSLILSCVFSTLLAIILLVFAVLPVEFNIDPTGFGKAMGLTVLAQTEDSSEKPSVISCPKVGVASQMTEDKEVAIEHLTRQWQDTVSIKVPAYKGLEYKFYIEKNETLEFVWNTEGTALYFDFHGEPSDDKTGYFKSFKEDTQNQSSGTLTVPFTGSHGWYWKNTSSKEVIINLQTRGNYKIIGFP
ncbi:MAG: hypothetical protein HFP81_02300 [Methylococcales symbiont of Hymedesmia sp. n. MRB-2018]|nr:MAG: hypothetical protein HFP81_02300 [Methylococcales symbiont of Hymedesmia sp. n. MRB-2018]